MADNIKWTGVTLKKPRKKPQKCYIDKYGYDSCKVNGVTCLYYDYTRKHHQRCPDDRSQCGIQQCTGYKKSCVTAYRFKPYTGMHSSFCGGDADYCEPNKCIFKLHPTLSFYICCCNSGNLCNNVTLPQHLWEKHRPTKTTTPTPTFPLEFGLALHEQMKNKSDFGTSIYILLVLLPLITLLIVFFITLSRLKRKYRHIFTNNLHCFNFTWKGFQLTDIIHKGTFATVYKAQAKDGRVTAVKIFEINQKKMWQRELSIFLLVDRKHDAILNYLYSGMIPNDSGATYFISTEYHRRGSLRKFLATDTLDLNIAMKQMLSITSGLTFLHSNKYIERKMIVHRDLKSSNIIVKNDFSCCISDFGSAIEIDRKMPNWINYNIQAGTIRYMPPEILQGSVAYQPEAFSAIDIYGLGLVMWEILSRCHSFSQPGEYKQPYWNKVGPNPTIDEMRECVTENVYRPDIKAEWIKDPNCQLIVKTMQECWEDEPGARLTVDCVYTRLLDIEKKLRAFILVNGDRCPVTYV